MKDKKCYEKAVFDIIKFCEGDVLEISDASDADVVRDPYDVIWW